MTKQSRVLLTWLFACGLVLSFTLMAVAQSGRRVIKPTPQPPVATTTGATTVAKPSPEKPAPRVTLVVGIDQSDSFSRIPLGATTGVLQSFVDRLKASPSVKLVVDNQSLGRGEAVRKAKSEKEGHIVWLQVGLDTMGASQGANTNIRDVFIEFVVLAPGTAKTVVSGRTYPYTYRSRSVIPSTRGPGIYGDYRYNEAAREAAERVLAAFRISTRPIRLP
ncbi:MAG: hypothetical protein AABN95_20380 [Acidobacteriota bacterium]